METILTRIKVEILENTEWAREVNPVKKPVFIDYGGDMDEKERYVEDYDKWDADQKNLREFKIEKCHKDCNCEEWQTTPVCPCKVVGSIHSAEILNDVTIRLVS